MKSFRYFYLLAALMAFSACGDDDEASQEQDLTTTGGKVLINAVVEPNSLLRAAILWEKMMPSRALSTRATSLL